MRKKYFIFKGMLILALFMIIMSIKYTNAEANNYVDTSFNDFYSGYNIVKTDYRFKSDSSSAYIYNSGSPCGVYVDVWGSYALYSDNKYYPRPGSEICCNYNGTVLVEKGQSKKLLNHVNENPDYLNAAQLRMTGTLLRVYLSGVWSPDSI